MGKLFHTTAALSVLLATSMGANAADVPPYAPPAAPAVYLPPPLSWTGFYIGVNLGGAWGQRKVTDSLFGLSFDTGINKGAFIGGGQLGFNYQFGNFVLGVEGDIDGVANTNNASNGPAGPGGTILLTSNNRWIATLAGRFGVTNGYWLFYGKAGGGLGRQRRLHHHQYGDGRIDHWLQQQYQQRLVGRRGHRMGFCAQLVGEDRV